MKEDGWQVWSQCLTTLNLSHNKFLFVPSALLSLGFPPYSFLDVVVVVAFFHSIVVLCFVVVDVGDVVVSL